MAQVLPAERDLRRVIGDGDTVPDGEVEGVDAGPARPLPLDGAPAHLRRAFGGLPSPGADRDLRDLLGPRGDPGRRVPRARREDWIFPSYRESAIGLLRGIAPATILLVAGIRRAGGTPRTTTSPRSASRSRPRCRMRPGSAWGNDGARRDRLSRADLLRRQRDLRGRVPRGANLAAVMRAPLVLLCNNNQWAISTPLSAQTRAEALVDKAVGYGIPGCASTARTCSPSTRRREAVARARAGEADVHRGRHVPLRSARDGRRSSVHRSPKVEEARASECLGRYEGICAGQAYSTRQSSRRSRARPPRRCGPGSPPRRPSRLRDIGLVFEHALADPPSRSSTTSPS